MVLTEKDLEVIGEQIAKTWIATQGFTTGYLLDDNQSDEDPDNLYEDFYEY